MTVESLPVEPISVRVTGEVALFVRYWMNRLDMTPAEFTKHAYGLMRLALEMSPDEELIVVSKRARTRQKVLLPWREKKP